MVYVRATIVRDSGDFLSEWQFNEGRVLACKERQLGWRCRPHAACPPCPIVCPALPLHATTAGRAVTIATRYAAVRRQTTSKLGEPELQVRCNSLGTCCCVATWLQLQQCTCEQRMELLAF